MAATFQLAGAQIQTLTYLQLLGYFGECGTLDKIGTIATQVPFFDLRKTFVNSMTNNKIQRCITEKLQTFIVDRTMAAMGKG